MAILIAVTLFVFLMAAIGYVGYRYYAQPGRYFEQIGESAALPGFEGTSQGRGVVVTLVKELGEKIPISPEEATTTRRYLFAAGHRADSALGIYYGIRVLMTFVFLAIGWIAVDIFDIAGMLRIGLIVGFGFAGFFLPSLALDMMVKSRQERLRFALPDALDLLVVCVEAGLALDQAMVRVADELGITHPDISEEFSLVAAETRAGKRREEALRNLARRTGEPGIRKLVSVLVQTDKFGTSVAESLRTHADFMRMKRRQEAEERANKVGVKLVFPIFFCILPAMFLVVGGPGVLQIIKELIPLMRQFTMGAS